MRVTISPVARPQDTVTLVDGSHLNSWPIQGDVFILEKDGIAGWFEPADPRVEDQPDIPRQNGTFWPEEVFLSGRVLTVRGFHGADYSAGSSLSASVFRDRLAAWVGTAVTVTVEDAAGPREVVGFVAAAPVPTHLSEVDTRFSLVVNCPDPLKYGPRADFPVSGSSVTVVNAGTGLVAPVFTVSSAVSVLDVRLGDAHVRWQGSALSLVLDLADGRPLGPGGQETGSLIYADLLRIPQGEHVLSVECDGDLTVSVRSGWK